jgi:hypothetical protein
MAETAERCLMVCACSSVGLMSVHWCQTCDLGLEQGCQWGF